MTMIRSVVLIRRQTLSESVWRRSVRGRNLRSVRFRTCETAKCPVSHLRNVRNAKCPVAKVGEGTAYAANDAVGRITDAVYDDAKKEVTAYTDV